MRFILRPLVVDTRVTANIRLHLSAKNRLRSHKGNLRIESEGALIANWELHKRIDRELPDSDMPRKAGAISTGMELKIDFLKFALKKRIVPSVKSTQARVASAIRERTGGADPSRN